MQNDLTDFRDLFDSMLDSSKQEIGALEQKKVDTGKPVFKKYASQVHIPAGETIRAAGEDLKNIFKSALGHLDIRKLYPSNSFMLDPEYMDEDFKWKLDDEHDELEEELAEKQKELLK